MSDNSSQPPNLNEIMEHLEDYDIIGVDEATIDTSSPESIREFYRTHKICKTDELRAELQQKRELTELKRDKELAEQAVAELRAVQDKRPTQSLPPNASPPALAEPLCAVTESQAGQDEIDELAEHSSEELLDEMVHPAERKPGLYHVEIPEAAREDSKEDEEASQCRFNSPVDDDKLEASLFDMAMAMGDDDSDAAAQQTANDWHAGGNRGVAYSLESRGRIGRHNAYLINDLIDHFTSRGDICGEEIDAIRSRLIATARQRKVSDCSAQ